ncbi:hypothetical protein J7M23_12945 [Candidatus Sumerlaeota bacterium]|nr:hypothetical protein [Candidatus Sumerlaeota bacterium]
MTAARKIAQIEETRNDLKQFYELWLRFRKYYLKAFTTEPITREEEQEFLEIKSEIAKYQRVLSEEVHESLYFAGDKAIELLRKSISVAHLRTLPLVDKQLYYKLWHYIFIYLGRTLGAYQLFSEGFVPPKRSTTRDEGVTISTVKSIAGTEGESYGQTKKKSKSSGGKIVGIILLIIIIAIALIFLLQR